VQTVSPSPVLVAVAGALKRRATPGETLVVGVTGSVAVGKTTVCGALASALAPLRVDTLSTDGFLMPNAALAERGVLPRKGFPETFDADAMLAALREVRACPILVPVHSHVVYDIDPALARTVDRPDILLVEGLGLSGFPDGRHAADALDVLIYLDADEDDLERWFVDRFMGFWRAAEHDPASFYARFRALDEAGADQLARSVWTGVNRVNLREHVVAARDRADILLRKAGDHDLTALRGV
jgi:type I pantothenate kinase